MWSLGRGMAVAVVLLALPGARVVAQEPQAAAPYVIVVHPEVAGTAVPREMLKQILLKEVGVWGDGSAIVVVDQSLSSPVRKRLSQDVIGRSPEQLLQYWQQKISRGGRPPVVKKSDDEVLEYVASKAGAIGYVSAATNLDEAAVKVLRIAADQ